LRRFANINEERAGSAASTPAPDVSIYREQGVVLRTHRLGEADKIVVVLTEGRGKVRAVAKGIRKTKSKFGARLEPMTHVELQLYEGRELDTITQAETLETFRHVREDLERVGRAGALLEAVDQLAQEREPNVALYRMLLGALRSLAKNDSVLIVASFYWKLLSQEGVHPLLDECAACGSPESDVPLVAFDLEQGGTLCRSCRRGTAISPQALALLRDILGGQLARALLEPPSDATSEVDALATRALEHHLERRLKAVSNARWLD
jgi:DNA repair protein RecO (recombination protein O)